MPRLRLHRIRQLRPHEDLPEAVPPLQLRRWKVPASSYQCRTDVSIPIKLPKVLLRDIKYLFTNDISAGGGGGSDNRKAKIQAKNEKLNDERQRNAKQINKDKKKHDKPRTGAATGANAAVPEEAPVANGDDDKYAGVHPSRRPRMW